MNKVKKGNVITYTDKHKDILHVIYGTDGNIYFKFYRNGDGEKARQWKVTAKEFIDAFRYETGKDWIRFHTYTTNVVIFKPKQLLSTAMVFTPEEADDLYFTILDIDKGESAPEEPKPVFNTGKTDLTTPVQVKLDNIEMSVKVTPNYDPRETDIRDLGKIINKAINDTLAGLTLNKKI